MSATSQKWTLEKQAWALVNDIARPNRHADDTVLGFDHDAILLTGRELAAKRIGCCTVGERAHAQAVIDPTAAEIRANGHNRQSTEGTFMEDGQALGLNHRTGLRSDGPELNAKAGASGRRR